MIEISRTTKSLCCLAQ